MNTARSLARESVRDAKVMEDAITHFTPLITNAKNIIFFDLIKKLESGGVLSFEEAFAGSLSMVAVNNSELKNRIFPNVLRDDLEKQAVVFLLTMRFQEERGRITPDEIAGMVAATRLDFTYLVESDSIVETCGMGGDIGFGPSDFQTHYADLKQKIKTGFYSSTETTNLADYYNFLMNSIVESDRAIKQSYKTINKKSANISTLSSLIAVSLGYPTMKHGSGKNTTAVGSTDAIRDFGFPVGFSSSNEPQDFFEKYGFVFTDAALSKSIHDISGQVLRTETVNHLIGPLTPPISRKTQLNKVLGINHNINFDVVGRSYELLKSKGVYNVGNIIIVGGFKNIPDITNEAVHLDVCLDEFSPLGSVLGVIRNGNYLGKFAISQKDFGISINLDDALLNSDEAVINSANSDILSNTANEDLIKLVCCNAALVIMTTDGSIDQDDFILVNQINPVYLQRAFLKARKAISELRVHALCTNIRKQFQTVTQP